MDMIKGVLFFKFSGEVPLRNKGREDALPHPNEASGICFFIATRKMGMEVLTKGVSFFKIQEREFCFSKIEKRRFVVVKIMDSPIEFHICRDTFCITGVEGERRKGL